MASSVHSSRDNVRRKRKMIALRSQLFRSTTGFIWVLSLAQLLALPFASPFANAGSQTSQSQQHHHTKDQQNSFRAQQDVLSCGGSPTSPLFHSMAKAGENVSRRYTLSEFFNGLRYTPKRDEHSRQEHGDKKWKKSKRRADIFSRLLFNYATPLLKIAPNRHLDQNDSFDVEDEMQMTRSVTSLTRIYDLVKSTLTQEFRDKGKDPTSADAQAWMLTKALLFHQRRMLYLTAILRFANTAIQACPAILVSRLLRLVEAGNVYPAKNALMQALALFLVLSTKMVIENQYFHNVVKCSTQVRGSLAGMIFDKSLRLPSSGSGVLAPSRVNATVWSEEKRPSLGAGEVLNLMQSDASMIESAAMQLHTIWDGPLQIAVYTSLLYRYLGSSIFWGIAVLLVTIPVNSIALRILNRLSKYENEAKDARTKRTAESISNMKLLKLQGWEKWFAQDIRAYRREELRRLVTRGAVRAINTAYSNAVPSLVLVVTLMAYVRSGKPIVASTIFTAISLFNQLRFPLFFYPMLIDSLANGRTAMRRIAEYLTSDENPQYVSRLPPLIFSDGMKKGGSIEMRNGNFYWPNSRSKNHDGHAAPALANVEMKVNPGEVVAVVGSVGSGKTALIKGLLGELNPVPSVVLQQGIDYEDVGTGTMLAHAGTSKMFEKPNVITHGNVAYCSQEAWLSKGTIRDAILFGREYNEERYRIAIRDAGLDRDIADEQNGASTSKGMLSHNTDVGEGGSLLSGGQRARVALARAFYSGEDTKVFLLDDCLAALDSSVGSTVFERIINRIRSANAAAILVTNDPSLPRRCDRVVLMGTMPGSSSCSMVVDVGTYDELIARGHQLRSLSAAETDEKEDVSLESSMDELQSTFISPVDQIEYRNGYIQTAGLIDRQTSLSHFQASKDLTNVTDHSCHADPEFQLVMENCPDFINNDVTTGRSEDAFDEIMLFDGSNATSDLSINGKGEANKQVLTDDLKSLQKVSVDETMLVGAVPLSTYISYIKSVRKPLIVVAMIASYLMVNGAQFFQQYTVAKWTEASTRGMSAALNVEYMNSLLKAAWAVSAFLWLRSFLTMQVGVRASEYLHSRMLSSVFSAPMSFFDATPSGQLLARFGREIETVDRGVPDSLGTVLFCFLQIFMSIGALASVVTPGMIFPLGAASVLYGKTMSLYRPAARDLKRAETKTRSPILSHFGEALRGTETIRSFPGSTLRWSEKHRSLSDVNIGVFSTIKIFDRWLSTRLESLGNFVVFTAAIAAVLLTRAGRLQAGSAGWGLTQSLSITGLMTWAVKCLTDLETNMMSVLRVQEISSAADADVVGFMTQAGSPPIESSRPGEALARVTQSFDKFNTTLAPLDSNALLHSGWPWRGHVTFSNVSMRYNPSSPLILKRINLVIPAGSTVGIVGRTGSGKSSLLLTLFRLVEIERGGSIEIDGVDIRSVGLDQLRQSLAIIPQDPVLFAGTIGYNLDATGTSSRLQMWSALEAASPSLAQQFRRTDGLDSLISEGGKNLSLGQRQLICLARALLRKSRILVLDEATSSVDSKTDQEVQDTIRREFVSKGVTVITVAHRLDTVLGYDRIAVLGSGAVLEYGAPKELLRRPNGELRKLVDADRKSKRKATKGSLERAYVA